MAIRVYCDQNFLINIRDESKQYKRKIGRLVSNGKVCFVLSPWHWVEMARGSDHGRSLTLADFADSLDPIWIWEIRTVHRHEVEALFFEFLNVEYSKPPPLCARSEVIADLSKAPIWKVKHFVSSDVVSYLQSHPKALRKIEDGYFNNRKARDMNRTDYLKGNFSTYWIRRFDKASARVHVPQRTPSGIIIDNTTQATFLDQFDIIRCPSLVTEDAVTKYGWEGNDHFRWQRFMDEHHVVAALPYVDFVVTDDVNLTKIVRNVRQRLPFPVSSLLTKTSFDERFILN